MILNIRNTVAGLAGLKLVLVVHLAGQAGIRQVLLVGSPNEVGHPVGPVKSALNESINNLAACAFFFIIIFWAF